MKFAAIKNTDKYLSRIGFGCANFGGIGSAPDLVGKGDSENTCHEMLDIAYASGINYFDTATTYGAGESERILGKWLKKRNISREKIVVSSKISSRVSIFPWQRGLSSIHIQRQLDLSLQRLQLDYLDLLFIHAPDPSTPLEETLCALSTAVKQGKVRKLGASNVDADYLRQAKKISKLNSLSEFEVIQNSYNFLHRKDEKSLIPYCIENLILYVAYSPLCGGLLSGKYHRDRNFPDNSRLKLRGSLYKPFLTDSNFSNIENLNAYAQSINVALPALMYAWLYRNSRVNCFLIGTRNKTQFNTVLNALDIQLIDSEWQKLDNLLNTA